jgi:endonuclease/exonuclease/phosphatase family metal-dependent hydrolase
MKRKQIYKKSMRVFSVVFFTLCAVFSCSKNPAKKQKTPEDFSAAVWNVQALFDGEETGNEYGEYLSAAGWNGEKYAARLTSISRALPQLSASDGPDLIGLVEIENAGILHDLARSLKSGYSWTYFANIPGASLGIGVLSRYPPAGTRIHSINSGGQTAPRPVLEIRLEPGGKPLVFFLCHWKSKRGGDAAAAGAMRRADARIILRRIREIHLEEPLTPVIIMGDLNENHDEFYRQKGTIVSALLPDAPEAAERGGAGDDCLVLSGEKPPVARHFNAPALYSPWDRELEGGSYYYKAKWETIDHFLLNGALFDGTGWDFETCRLINRPPFANSAGRPDPYTPRTGRGLSDHLPLVLFLKDAGAKDRASPPG